MITICSVIYNKQVHYILYDENTQEINFDRKPLITKFLYATIDDNYDLTYEFEKFKRYILENKNLDTYDIVKLMQMFFKNQDTMTNESTLKLMTDDSFDEKTYKGKEILLIS